MDKYFELLKNKIRDKNKVIMFFLIFTGILWAGYGYVRLTKASNKEPYIEPRNIEFQEKMSSFYDWKQKTIVDDAKYYAEIEKIDALLEEMAPRTFPCSNIYDGIVFGSRFFVILILGHFISGISCGVFICIAVLGVQTYFECI